MAQDTTAAPAKVKHQFDNPRPGRFSCTAVTDYTCLAPAGYRTGNGVAAVAGVRRSDLHTCGYCGEPVCDNCKTDFPGLGVACNSHSEEELLDWLRWTTPDETPDEKETATVQAPTLVYELLNGGRGSWSRIGVFSSIELAKEVAGIVLATYGQFADDGDVEGTNFDAEWVMRRDTIGPPSRSTEVGDPKPVLPYGAEGSVFKIDTIVLDQGRSVGEIIYPPTT